jgi:hypothetical protein
MAFEAFNQIIKSMFKHTNYKSAARSVADMWIFRSARALKRHSASLWSSDTACTASELRVDIDDMCARSELLREVRVPSVVAARALHSFTRGSVSIMAGAWVACQPASGAAYACQISEIVQVYSMSSWRIHMYASESFQLHHACETTWLTKPVSELACDRMIIDADSVHISELHVVFEGQNLRARYLW